MAPSSVEALRLQRASAHTARSYAHARADLWTDPAKGAAVDAKDTLANAGADDADVIFVHTHGGHRASPARSWLVMGGNADSCDAITEIHMRLGNGKLNIAVVKVCQPGNSGPPSMVTRRAATS
jgi:hypothetical protein